MARLVILPAPIDTTNTANLQINYQSFPLPLTGKTTDPRAIYEQGLILPREANSAFVSEGLTSFWRLEQWIARKCKRDVICSSNSAYAPNLFRLDFLDGWFRRDQWEREKDISFAFEFHLLFESQAEVAEAVAWLEEKVPEADYFCSNNIGALHVMIDNPTRAVEFKLRWSDHFKQAA